METRWSVILRRCGLVVLCIAVLCAQSAVFGWGVPTGCTQEDLALENTLCLGKTAEAGGAVLVCAPAPDVPVYGAAAQTGAAAHPEETTAGTEGQSGETAAEGQSGAGTEGQSGETAAEGQSGAGTNAQSSQNSTEADSEAQADKVVYLTFDDGPSATTEIILDVLREQGVPATFFVIAAENNEPYLPLLAREVSEGHTIGLHSCSHAYKKIYASTDAFWDDIAALREAIRPYGGADSMILRFPGGSSNTVSHRYGGSDIMERLKAQAAEQGYLVVNWNVCAEDAVGGHPSANTIYNNVVRDADDHDRCVVLMHDTKATKNTAAALPDIIAWFKNAGYRFDTVDHMER